ncbi:MAG: hypothetical protein C4518_19150 [Desulfobacteraceae bacterium]|nr:MAG: hypothetical protein C4518_19150 [Desulfobacteraceae bacterium]
MKKLSILCLIVFACSFFSVPNAQSAVLNFTDHQPMSLSSESKGLMHQMTAHQKHIPGAKSNGKNWGRFVSLVKLSGKINHFGIDITQTPPEYIDYHATVPGVQVWVAEYPFTKHMNILTDETGWWTIYVLKYKGEDLEFSFVYQKDGWVTTKSNVITVTDEDNTDIAIQYIDPLYYYFAMKPAVEQQISALLGFPFTLQNAMVVTVGKSWASMHDDRLPHGDPGATVSMTPAPAFPETIGPIYFNEAVQPDPTYTSTSVDGGVTWLNMPLGTYAVTAQKPDVEYDTVTFRVTETDVTNGVELYIASPPDSVQGDNDSGPGEN